ncbi:MAG TPA: hypothetical protein VJ180_04150 [Pyrinomonadaceae bacterium]|nr:hypothetical protein [Pyrinomonadaceae bacterium]
MQDKNKKLEFTHQNCGLEAMEITFKNAKLQTAMVKWEMENGRKAQYSSGIDTCIAPPDS